jgi:hypothetical protein
MAHSSLPGPPQRQLPPGFDRAYQAMADTSVYWIGILSEENVSQVRYDIALGRSSQIISILQILQPLTGGDWAALCYQHFNVLRDALKAARGACQQL